MGNAASYARQEDRRCRSICRRSRSSSRRSPWSRDSSSPCTRRSTSGGSRRDETALTLIRTTIPPEQFGTTVIALPDDATPEQIRALGPDVERSIIIACVNYENLGYLVYLRMIPLRLVDELIGGLIRQAWRKLRVWVAHARALGNPSSFEWFEWLYDRLEAHHAPT